MILRRDDDPLAIAARTAFLGLVALMCFASMAPTSWAPRLLDSYHLEHFAAFYLIALSMAAARYRANINRVLVDAAILASVIAVIRAFIPAHAIGAWPDWVAELGGILAALCPIMVAEFRQTFVQLAGTPLADEG